MLPDTPPHFDLCNRRVERRFAQFPSRWPLDLATIARLRKQDCARRIAVKMHAKRFYVSGRVQGVGFRFFAEGTAARLGVVGYVKNLFDGRVEVYAIGDEQQLRALQDALQRGPRMASVDRVEERDAEILAEYADGFTIEHDY